MAWLFPILIACIPIAHAATTTIVGSSVAGDVALPTSPLPGASVNLSQPVDVAIGPQGELYTTDAGLEAVFVSQAYPPYTTDVLYAAVNGERPAGVGVDGEGTVYFASASDFRVYLLVAGSLAPVAIAGNGAPGCDGDDGPALLARVTPAGIAVPEAGGEVYLADATHHVVRRVDLHTGVISRVAGRAYLAAYSGDGGLATAAALYSPTDVVVESSGSLLIADRGNNALRRVSPDGVIATVAGGNGLGSSGDGGPATLAQLLRPTQLAVGPRNTVYVVEQTSTGLRVVHGDGTISTLLIDGLRAPAGLAVDATGNVMLTDTLNRALEAVVTNEAPVVSNTNLSAVSWGLPYTGIVDLVAADADGSVNQTVFQIAATVPDGASVLIDGARLVVGDSGLPPGAYFVDVRAVDLGGEGIAGPPVSFAITVPGLVVDDTAAFAADDGSFNGTLTVALAVPPSALVDVWVSGDGGQVLLSADASGSLTPAQGASPSVVLRFSPTTWATPQTVSIQRNQALAASSRTPTASLRYAVTSADAGFDGVPTPSTIASISTAPLTVLPVSAMGGTVTGACYAGYECSVSWRGAELATPGDELVWLGGASGDVAAYLGTRSANSTANRALQWLVPTLLPAGEYTVHVQRLPNLVAVSPAFTIAPAFEFQTTPFGACVPTSGVCGTGFATRAVTCVDARPTTAAPTAHAWLAEDSHACRVYGAPPAAVEACVVPCDAGPSWRVGTWSDCSAPCGEAGTRVRAVDCVGGANATCDSPQPATEEACNRRPCGATFRFGQWSDCAGEECGTPGTTTRTQTCVDATGVGLPDAECANAKQSVVSGVCNMAPCDFVRYVSQRPTGDCSEPCVFGVGAHATQGVAATSSVCFRGVNPAPEDECEIRSVEPVAASVECNRVQCPATTFALHVGEWGACVTSEPGATCGAGAQSRTVACHQGVQQGGLEVDLSLCTGVANQLPMPEATSACTLPCACGTDADCGSSEACVEGVCTAAVQAGECEGAVAASGECCGVGGVLDVRGACCGDGETLDACGVCSGSGVAVDIHGACCTSPLPASGQCCPSTVDDCGVCGGLNACGLRATAVVSGPLPNASFAPAWRDLQEDIATRLAVDAAALYVTATNATSEVVVVVGATQQLLTADALAGLSDGTDLPHAGAVQEISAVRLPMCGNGLCEDGERCIDDGCASGCPADCPFVLKVCPSSTSAPCSGRGWCLPTTGVCSCLQGFSGADCSTCAPGFLSVGDVCVAATQDSPVDAAAPLPAANSPSSSSSSATTIVVVVAAVVVVAVIVVALLVIRRYRGRASQPTVNTVYSRNQPRRNPEDDLSPTERGQDNPAWELGSILRRASTQEPGTAPPLPDAIASGDSNASPMRPQPLNMSTLQHAAVTTTTPVGTPVSPNSSPGLAPVEDYERLLDSDENSSVYDAPVLLRGDRSVASSEEDTPADDSEDGPAPRAVPGTPGDIVPPPSPPSVVTPVLSPTRAMPTGGAVAAASPRRRHLPSAYHQQSTPTRSRALLPPTMVSPQLNLRGTSNPAPPLPAPHATTAPKGVVLGPSLGSPAYRAPPALVVGASRRRPQSSVVTTPAGTVQPPVCFKPAATTPLREQAPRRTVPPAPPADDDSDDDSVFTGSHSSASSTPTPPPRRRRHRLKHRVPYEPALEPRKASSDWTADSLSVVSPKGGDKGGDDRRRWRRRRPPSSPQAAAVDAVVDSAIESALEGVPHQSLFLQPIHE